MNINYLTRYIYKLNYLFKFINKKLLKLKKNLLAFVLILFFGFFIGNLFGTFVTTIRNYHIADSLLIFLIISLTELMNFTVYNRYKRKKNFYLIVNVSDFLNSFKIGVLLGFFIDSFKVGS